MTDGIVTIEEFARRLQRRKLEVGLADLRVTPNSGKFRTAEKRGLLKRIALRARAQGRDPAFPAKF